MGMYKEMRGSKKYGVSFSAGQSLQYRWMMHYFGTRQDSYSVAFTKHFPCESHLGLLFVMGPLIIAQKYFGLKTKMTQFVEAGYETYKETAGVRVRVFDEYFVKYLEQVEQVVQLGSGFDLLLNRFTQGKNLHVFELDQTKTMEMKVATLQKAAIPHEWINYISVDYEQENWVDKLIESGFDRNKPTLFIWQSVSLYLDETTVMKTEKQLSDLCQENSIIIQDFYAKELMDGTISKIAKKNMDLISKMGEPWKFTLSMKQNPVKEVQTFLRDSQQEVIDYYLFGNKLPLQKSYIITVSERTKEENKL
jgi:methyltransferase (TIGR00027 family)